MSSKVIKEIVRVRGARWLLINPPVIEEFEILNPLNKTWGSGINLGLVQCAKTILHFGGEVEILDLSGSVSASQIIALLGDVSEFDAFCISNNFFTTYMSSIYIAELLKSKTSKPVVLGGSHIGSFRGDEIGDGIHVCHGEFEEFVCSPESFYGAHPIYLWPKTSNLYYVLEVSRGCPYGCLYCHRYDYKKRYIEDVYYEIDYFSNDWGNDKLAYATYNFGQDVDYETKVLDRLKNLNVNFTTQGRSDTLHKNGFEFMKRAASAGLTNLSIGIETVRHDVLRLMRKTNNPEEWISSSVEIFKWCYDLGITIKLNILLFNGENSQTLDDLHSFLIKNKSYISGVSCSPIMAFPGTNLYGKHKIASFESPELEKYFTDRKVYPINISDNFTFEETLKISEDFEGLFPGWRNIIEKKMGLSKHC